MADECDRKTRALSELAAKATRRAGEPLGLIMTGPCQQNGGRYHVGYHSRLPGDEGTTESAVLGMMISGMNASVRHMLDDLPMDPAEREKLSRFRRDVDEAFERMTGNPIRT